eukprot:scaffold3459_cov30-Phaeocystis_antarctica.AAC.1
MEAAAKEAKAARTVCYRSTRRNGTLTPWQRERPSPSTSTPRALAAPGAPWGLALGRLWMQATFNRRVLQYKHVSWVPSTLFRHGLKQGDGGGGGGGGSGGLGV